MIRRTGRGLAGKRVVFACAFVAVLGSSCSPASSAPAASRLSPAPAASRLSPLADVSLTPPGWAPVGLGPIQISVPSSWLIEDPGYACGGGAQGMVFVNQSPMAAR
jgi:hypothetical protein